MGDLDDSDKKICQNVKRVDDFITSDSINPNGPCPG